MYALGPFVNYSAADAYHALRRVPQSKELQLENRNMNNALLLSDLSDRHGAGDLMTYIFPDFKAVTYFQKEFIALNEFHVAEEAEALGFEIYLVDQWIRGRKIGGVVSAYTGNKESKVKVIKFTILRKPSKQYPARFQEYLNEMMMNHATFKKMETETSISPSVENLSSLEDTAANEFLLVTNLAALPSNLNLISVPEGDARLVEERFVLNSNLKKLNCGGRSLSLAAHKISDACEDKFRQMYKLTDDTIPAKFAIRQLVNLIQTCLFYFDFLDARYCDGLLCQKTEDAISNWWSLIGLPHFNVKPNSKSGILSSKTVAAILSLTLSVRLRLQLYGGCDVPKDVFDFENFMLSIGHFQKQMKIEKRRKLDLLTLLRLFSATNQKYPSDSTKHTGDLSEDDHEDFYDPYVGSNGHGKGNLAFNQSPSSSSLYKRNRIYYSKELKKLTNAVKNTVQDHIIVREDDDNFFDPKTSGSSGKIRKKIASKLVDNVLPSDIETLDLDYLVRKHLVGKTLKTLWYGAYNRGDQHQKTLHVGQTGNFQKKENGQNDQSENTSYKFISLRDAITMDQTAGLVSTDRNKRGGRMRFGFQGRRGTVFTKADMINDLPNPCAPFTQHDSLLDAQLEKLACVEDPEMCKAFVEECPQQACQKDLRCLLNRRNSFPFFDTGGQLNLNTIEFMREERFDILKLVQDRPSLKRSISFSRIELHILRYECPLSEEQMCVEFLKRMLLLLKIERYKAETSKSGNQRLKKMYQQVNFELVKLQNVYSYMQAKHETIEETYSAVLAGRIRDITDNIDRMAFRSRDLSKKIKELDENTGKFSYNLENGTVRKLDEISEHLIRSPKFQRVFRDEAERRLIILKLTGQEHVENDDESGQNSYWGLRILLTFFYELMVLVLQVFHFDRSKMDLDRIRKLYRKIDPNRRYIDKAYQLVGREPKPSNAVQ